MKTSNVFNKFYTYILFSKKDKGFYIGFTTDLRKRLITHSKGLVPSTKFRRPLFLIHYEYFIDKSDAKAREKYLKSGYGRIQIQQILKRTLVNLI
ncbi:MAG: GIY-YIG nuclease family protein [Candidatus Microgenomates bacterium]